MSLYISLVLHLIGTNLMNCDRKEKTHKYVLCSIQYYVVMFAIRSILRTMNTEIIVKKHNIMVSDSYDIFFKK